MSDVYNSKIAKWIGKLNKSKSGEWAITITKNTTLYSCGEQFVNDAWRKHEDCHKSQIAKEGLMFYLKYVFYNLTKGYWNNPYEVEARK